METWLIVVFVVLAAALALWWLRDAGAPGATPDGSVLKDDGSGAVAATTAATAASSACSSASSSSSSC